MTTIGLDCLTTTGALTVNGTLLHGYAWCAYDDLSPLWVETRARGEDTTVPGTPGVLPRERVMDVNEHSVALAIAGHLDQAGAPYGDSWVGAVTNLQALTAALTDATFAAADGTVMASLDLFGDASVVYAGPVHVLGIRLGRKLVTQPVWRGSLELSIPGGRLELVP